MNNSGCEPVRDVTVIVPTYRRAHLLASTLPSYLQPEVARLILVDDCSPDETAQVAADLAARDARISYLRNETNRKQTYSKNRALALVETEYVYFGDDDSMLDAGGIAALKETMAQSGADIVGAAALYMRDGESVDDTETRRETTDRSEDIVRLSKLHFNFSVKAPAGIEVAVCQAAFLARTSAIGFLRFDEHYGGNCYREETDFLLACRAHGCRIALDTRVRQINLPPSRATGGARSRSRMRYEWYAFANTVRFLHKNRRILKQLDPRCSCFGMLGAYVFNRVEGALRKLGLHGRA